MCMPPLEKRTDSSGETPEVPEDPCQHWRGILREWTGWISLQSKGLSRVFSNTTVQMHQFFSTQLSLWSNSHIHPHPSVISFETRLQGSHLKSGHFNAMYHNVRLTAPAVSTCEGPVILLQGLPDVLYQASSCNSTNKWVLLTFLYQRTGD